MRCMSVVRGATLFTFLAVAMAATAHAQVGGLNGAPWRGAGDQPCFGIDGAANKCPAPLGTLALRAGKLFDAKSAR